MSVVGLLFGHSFVTGYKQHLSNYSSVQLNPKNISKLLRLENKIPKFHIHGSRGALIQDNNFPWNLVVDLSPELVIIDLGTNDLVAGKKPLVAAYQLSEIADNLNNSYKVSKIVLCAVTPRISFLSNLSTVEFQSLRQQFNHILRTFCEDKEHLAFHDH